MSDPVAVHDVGGIDPRPHGHPKLRELATNLRELAGERALGRVELGGALEQHGAFGMQRK
jgi:hypothetical protein